MAEQGRTLNARAVRKLGGLVVLQYYLTSRLASLYAIDHQNTVGALDALMERLDAFHRDLGRLTVKVEQGYVFVNEVRLRVDAAIRQALEWFVERFEASGLRSLTLLPELKPVEIKRMIPMIALANWEEGAPPPPLGRDLREAFVLHVKVRMRRRRDEDEDEEHRVEVSSHALGAAIFARLRELAQGFVERGRQGQPIVLKGAKLLVQQASDLIAEDPAVLLALTAARRVADDEDAYLARHMASACVLSLAMAVRLGLARPHLLALGCAALVYDLGMARVPLELRAIPGPLPQEALPFVKRHPLWSAAAILSSEDRTEQAFVAAVVAARHHPGAAYPSIIAVPRSLHADLVAVADAYDALLSPRPWRRPHQPAEALRLLLASGSPYDQSLTRLLAAIVGVYPAGALVELDTGEVGIVEGPGEGDDPFRPRLKLLIDGAGQGVDGVRVSLAERLPDGRYRRSVARILDADALEVSLEDLVAIL